MSIKIRREYLVDRIEIEERDPSIFADLAYFFDREDVLNEIATQRKAWIGDKILPHDKIDDFINRDMTNEEAKKFWWKQWPQLFKIARMYGLRVNFIRPIIAAILSGVITEKDYVRIFKEPPIDNLPEEYKLSDETIYVSNGVRDIDLQALRTKIDDKSIATVKRDREWYWLYQKMGYRKIAQLKKQTLTTVISAIKIYSSRLQIHYSVTK